MLTDGKREATGDDFTSWEYVENLYDALWHFQTADFHGKSRHIANLSWLLEHRNTVDIESPHRWKMVSNAGLWIVNTMANQLRGKDR